MEDARIVALYRARQETALAATSEKYGQKLYCLSYNILNSDPDAKECENDTYLAAWNAIPPHDPAGYLFSFLARICRNLSLNRWEKNHAQKRAAPVVELSRELEECLPAPDCVTRQAEEAEFARILEDFLRSLPAAECNVFLRRYWFCDPVAAIARRFAFTESKVKSMLARTRQKLRLRLEKEGYAP